MQTYAHPEVLVTTDWVANHLNDPNTAIVEVDVDTAAYDEGHIPNAIAWNWHTQLNDPVRRDIVSREQLEMLLSTSGIGNDTTIVVYGDNNNWFAAWAFWQFKLYGHKDVRIMNGGRKKWLAELRELTKDSPARRSTKYRVVGVNEAFRAYRRQVEDLLNSSRGSFVDVRSPDEFTGKILSPPGLPETAQRRRDVQTTAGTGKGLPTARRHA
jgi:thiosulfate/3-mercaptopyruvate sulfurtransferase